MKYEKRICLKTIAYELGTSINTVSRALRDCDDISTKTKEKVRKIALEMGYLPNSLVYSINNDTTKSVCLVINNIKNHYYQIINDRLVYHLRNEGYLVNIICLFGNDFDSDIVKECIYERADSIITFVEPTKEALDLVEINHLPLIFCGRKVPKKYGDTLYTDDVKGGKIAADYLIKQGCENFVYINVKGSECSKRRFKGFKDELVSKNPSFSPKKVNIEHFDEKLNEFINQKNLGIFAYNDEHLYIILDKLESRGIDHSKIKFIGYDDVKKHVLGTKRYPSIGFDYEKIAVECVKLIKLERSGKSRHKEICFDVNLEDI